jgi:hypothetical protein
MHIVFGFMNIILGRSLAGLYRGLRLDFIGSSAVRRCCAAFSAGAGLDDGAIDALRQMGPDGVWLLESEVTRTGEWSTAGHLLKLLLHEADEKGTS